MHGKGNQTEGRSERGMYIVPVTLPPCPHPEISFVALWSLPTSLGRTSWEAHLSIYADPSDRNERLHTTFKEKSSWSNSETPWPLRFTSGCLCHLQESDVFNKWWWNNCTHPCKKIESVTQTLILAKINRKGSETYKCKL